MRIDSRAWPKPLPIKLGIVRSNEPTKELIAETVVREKWREEFYRHIEAMVEALK